MPNHLFYGDNLGILRDRIGDESVDLIYLDPPFNSNATYNVLFRSPSGDAAEAQIHAFDDTWHWNNQTDEQFDAIIGGGHPRVADALLAMRNLLGTNDMLAYLTMMAARLAELRRVLKPTGSIYLHCDPTASHYLKVLLDAVFGPTNFRNEIIWKRTTAHNSAKRWGPVHDAIFFYTRGTSFTWNQQHQSYDPSYVASKYRFTDARGRYRLSDITGPGERQGESGRPWRGYDPTAKGRHWQPPSYCYWKYQQLTGRDLATFPFLERLEELDRVGLIYWPDKEDGRPEHRRYLADMPGVALQDVITDIDPINARAAERLGYQTQKPLALLERIISASSNEGDVVLDPFCGCGTTIDAAEKLHRRWIGIDITYIAIDLIRERLKNTYGDEIETTYEVHGVPADEAGARALFAENPFDFERWAVSLVDAQPNEKQVGDRGIDGRMRFHVDAQRIGQVLVSVKGGRTVNPAMVRDLRGTVEREGAEMGLLITLAAPTRGVRDEAAKSGNYTSTMTEQTYPRIQVATIADLMAGRRPRLPTAIRPYVKARPRGPEQLTLGAD